MDPTVTVLLAIGTVLFALWIVGVISTYFYITGKFKIDYSPLSGDHLETIVREALAMETIDPQWLVETGFLPVAGYCLSFSHSARKSFIVIWKLADESTFLSVTDHAVEPAQIDIHTPLKDGMLSTGSEQTSLAQFPCDGYWAQAFGSLDVAALYERHADALSYIVMELGQPRDDSPIDPIDLAKSTMFRGIDYLRQKPFWPLWMPYWTVVVFRYWHQRFNKTIREQVAQFGTNLGGWSRPHLHQ